MAARYGSDLSSVTTLVDSNAGEAWVKDPQAIVMRGPGSCVH